MILNRINLSKNLPPRNNIAFAGNSTTGSVCESFGKFSSKNKTFNSFMKKVDFNGHNLALPVIAFMTFGVVLLSRLKEARDPNERREVCTRDTLAITTIVFGVPLLNKVFAALTKKVSGIPVSTLDNSKEGILGNLKNLIKVLKHNPVSFERLEDWFTLPQKNKKGLQEFAQLIDSLGGKLGRAFKMGGIFDKDLKKTWRH